MAPHLEGSERAPIGDANDRARLVGDADPNQIVEVTILLRSSAPLLAPASVDESLSARQYLTREQLRASAAPDPNDIHQVRDFAVQNHLTVLRGRTGRELILKGRLRDLSKAFGVTLSTYEADGGIYRVREGPITVPPELSAIVEGVFGLDDRPQSEPRSHTLPGHQRSTRLSFKPSDIGRMYNFPTGPSGNGQCIAILEFGGGYRQREIDQYFRWLGISPTPTIRSVSVDGAQNRPGFSIPQDREVALDIEVAGAVAPGATIVVYFAPNTSRGWLDGIRQVIYDEVHNPSVLSISWGQAEMLWTDQLRRAIDGAFQEAAALGITVLVSSGDDGSSDGIRDGHPHVDFPASSPHAVACGGTRLNRTRTRFDEIAWNDLSEQHGASGGGVSEAFALPPYQTRSQVPLIPHNGGAGRGVPDISGNASPRSGYVIWSGGTRVVIGGTSAVAPLFAGLTALMNEKLEKSDRRVGFLNPLLYGPLASEAAFYDVVAGDNGDYTARPGWDACTGLGRPDGSKMLLAIERLARPSGPDGAPSTSAGCIIIPAGADSGTVSGVNVTNKTLVLATVQGDEHGKDVPQLWVRAAVPGMDGKSIQIHLNRKSKGHSVRVGWQIIEGPAPCADEVVDLTKVEPTLAVDGHDRAP